MLIITTRASNARPYIVLTHRCRRGQIKTFSVKLRRGLGAVPKRTCFSSQIKDLMKNCRVTLVTMPRNY
jgi:hypothetical protein